MRNVWSAADVGSCGVALKYCDEMFFAGSATPSAKPVFCARSGFPLRPIGWKGTSQAPTKIFCFELRFQQITISSKKHPGFAPVLTSAKALEAGARARDAGPRRRGGGDYPDAYQRWFEPLCEYAMTAPRLMERGSHAASHEPMHTTLLGPWWAQEPWSHDGETTNLSQLPEKCRNAYFYFSHVK